MTSDPRLDISFVVYEPVVEEYEKIKTDCELEKECRSRAEEFAAKVRRGEERRGEERRGEERRGEERRGEERRGEGRGGEERRGEERRGEERRGEEF